jgi:D-arginine dehydrogenase
LVPILREEAIAAAAIEWDAQDIDVDRMLQGFARKLRVMAAGLSPERPVTRFPESKSGWTVVTPAGEFTAPVVINAAGGWADAVGETGRCANSWFVRFASVRGADPGARRAGH